MQSSSTDKSSDEEKKDPLDRVHNDDDDVLEDEYDDEEPFTYSDDSASLSDAYFFPTEHERYRGEHEPLYHLRPFPVASYYGSLGALQEDSDVFMETPINANRNQAEAAAAAATSQRSVLPNGGSGKKERKRQRRRHQQRQSRSGGEVHRSQQQRMLILKQREKQVARERAVTRVRGQPQKDEWKDVSYAILFLLQLVAVVLCAIVFGFGLVRFQPEMTSSSTAGDSSLVGNIATTTTTTSTFLHQRAKPEYSGGKTRKSVALTSNATLGQEVVYADDDTHTGGGGDRHHQLDSSTLTTKSSSSVESAFLFTFDFQNVVELVAITGFYACIMTCISFGFMLILEKRLIQLMLVFSVLLALAWGLIGLSLDPYGVISIMGFAALVLTLGYAMYNWNRIPFAATNLYTALCAMRCTADITILGLASLVVAFGWSVVWSMAFVGLVNLFNTIECDRDMDACAPHLALRYWPLFFVLLLSFHWTNMVIKNVVHVTCSSIIATWWFRPEKIGPFCTAAVRRPLLSALTKSLGPICQGSLIINFAQIITLLGNGCCCIFGNSECMYNRKSGGGRFAGATMVSETDSAAESVDLGRRLRDFGHPIGTSLRSCNRWAFTYIGMYGYGFRDGGEMAMHLFETREWLDLARDNLIQNVLSAASIVIGGSAGTIAVVIEEADGYYFSSFHMPTFSAFVIGSVLGFVLSHILLLGLVGSAVNTILVCFAAAPFEFDRTHPKLSREMREVWSQHVWEEPSV